MDHHFNTFIAQKYGVNEAIIVHNFYFWIEKNKANGSNFHDGKTWTYNSISALAELFPYLSERQIRHSLDKLIEAGVLIKGNYNTAKYDRTLWYSLSDDIDRIYKPEKYNVPATEIQPVQDCQIHLTNLSNGSDKNVQPIPYSKPYRNTDNTGKEEKQETSASLKEKTNLLAKEIKKLEKKDKPADPMWKIYVDVWFLVNKAKTEGGVMENTYEPPFATMPRERIALQSIAHELKVRADKSGRPWDEQNIKTRLYALFKTAYSKDDWLKNNFSLHNIHSQLTQIFKLAEHGRTETNAKNGTGKTFGKSSGAISLIERLRGEYDEGAKEHTDS